MSLLSLPDLDQETHPYCSSNFQVESSGYPETLVIEMEDDPVPTTSVIQHRQLSTYDRGTGVVVEKLFCKQISFLSLTEITSFCLSVYTYRTSHVYFSNQA